MPLLAHYYTIDYLRVLCIRLHKSKLVCTAHACFVTLTNYILGYRAQINY